MAAKKKNNNPFLNYKDKPLVRQGNTIYYGYPMDKYVAMMQILNSEQVDGEDMAGDISIAIISTDESLPMKDRIVKTTSKKGLYPALHIADIWLDRALEKSEDNAEIAVQE